MLRQLVTVEPDVSQVINAVKLQRRPLIRLQRRQRELMAVPERALMIASGGIPVGGDAQCRPFAVRAAPAVKAGRISVMHAPLSGQLPADRYLTDRRSGQADDQQQGQ